MSDQVRRLNDQGQASYHAYLTALRLDRRAIPPFELLTDPNASESTGFSSTVERTPGGKPFANRYEFGTYLVQRLSAANRREISLDRGLWNWLSLYYFDQLCPPDDTGLRSPLEEARYFLPELYRYNRYYRHLVRTPWLAASLHPETSKVILIPISQKGPPLAVRGEIAEQVESRQGVFRSSTVMSAIYRMYFNRSTGRPHSGTGGNEGGSPRRLGRVLKQFDLTFDLEWGDENLVVNLLPKEFAKWKASAQAREN
jgi:hypothetical protein